MTEMLNFRTGDTAIACNFTITDTGLGPLRQVIMQASHSGVGSVTSNPLTGANASQMLTIDGSGFLSGTALKVVVGYPGFTATLSGGRIVEQIPRYLLRARSLDNIGQFSLTSQRAVLAGSERLKVLAHSRPRPPSRAGA